jgi:hypothetical protein
MLTIRKEQIHVISQPSDEAFIDRMVAYVRGDFPRQFEEMGPDGVRAFIREVMALGLRHEVEAGGAMAVLLQLTLMFGMNFERSPDAAWANELLSMVSVPDKVRMEMIRTRLASATQGRAIRKFTPPG